VAPLEIVAGEDRLVNKVIAQRGEEKIDFDTDGVFIFIGLLPNSQFLVNSPIELDKIGFVITDEHLQTAMPGVFAAGDVRSGATMQIASASGEGATSALMIREYLEGPKQ
jgi:thioredoxin reductase (NADPH)